MATEERSGFQITMRGRGIKEVTATNALDFLFVTLCISFTIKLNKRICWLTPAGLLSPVVPRQVSVPLPWDLPGLLNAASGVKT